MVPVWEPVQRLHARRDEPSPLLIAHSERNSPKRQAAVPDALLTLIFFTAALFSNMTAIPSDAATRERELPPLPTALGHVADLTTNTLAFSCPIECTDNTSQNSSLFGRTAFANLIAGRASAVIDDDIEAFLTVVPRSNATMIFATGAVAIRPTGSTLPGSLLQVLACPGSCALSVGMTGVSVSGKLGIPPGIQRDALVTQVLGKNPVITWHFNTVGVQTIILTIKGKVTVKGLGTVNPW